MDVRIILKQQTTKINQLELALQSLGSFISRQQAVMRSARDCLNVTDPNYEGIKVRIEDLLQTPPHGCTDRILELAMVNFQLAKQLQRATDQLQRVEDQINEITDGDTEQSEPGELPPP